MLVTKWYIHYESAPFMRIQIVSATELKMAIGGILEIPN